MRIITRDMQKKNNARFSGLRFIVFERDNYKCVRCGMKQEEHVDKWGKSLTINHINGIGRNSKSPDNDLRNLETLCLKCHGCIDGMRTTRNQYGTFAYK